VSEQLLNILKLFLLALVYLFFLRVLRAVWAEVNLPRGVEGAAGGRRSARREAMAAATVATAAGGAPAPPKSSRRAARAKDATELVIVEPTEQAGRRFALGDEMTVGRAAGCQVTLDDTYCSGLHARLFKRDGQLMVEDLGSTNGTYLNRSRVSGPMLVRRGDRLQVGNTVLEVT
jgi:hypothetical protein